MSEYWCFPRRRVCSVMLPLCLGWFCASACGAATLPAELRLELEKWNGRLRHLTVDWTRSRSSPFSASDLAAKLHWHTPSTTFFEPSEIHYSYQDGMVRQRKADPTVRLSANEQTVKGVGVEVGHIAFNKSVIYKWTGEKNEGRAVILSLNTVGSLSRRMREVGPDCPLLLCPLFRYVGLQMPDTLGELTQPVGSKALALEKDCKLVAASLDGGLWKLEFLDERRGARHRYALDPQHAYLARSYEYDLPTNPDFRMKNMVIARQEAVATSFEPVAGADFVFPRRVEVKNKDARGNELYTDVYEIREAKREDLPESYFEIVDTRPGITVFDGTLPGADKLPNQHVEYIMPARPEDLDKVIRAAMGQGQFTSDLQTTAPERRSTLWMLLVFNAALVAAFGAWYAYKTYRRRRSS
jgi:hypothetical protein